MNPTRRESILLSLLLLAYMLLLFYHIGDYPVWNKDEGLYADAVREMIERHNYLDPYFNYEHRWQKPILIYWVLLPFAWLWGADAWTLRLALACLALATLALTWLLARKLFPEKTIAFLSVFFLVSSASFILQSRHIATHLLLLFTVLLSFYFLADLLRGRRDTRTLLLFGASVGLAFLAKLYVGVVFILTTGFLLGAGEIWRHKAAFLRKALLSFAAFALVALPWYLYMLAHYRMEYVHFVYHEFFDRIGRNITGRNGPFFYVKVFFGNFAPWSILLLPLAAFHLKKHWGTLWRDLRANPSLLLILTGFFVVFVTLSIPKSKLPGYLFNLQGFAAILTALAFYHAPFTRLVKATLLGLQILLSLALIAIWILYFDDRSFPFALILAATLGLFFLKMRSKYLGIFRVGAVMAMLYFSVLGNIYPAISDYFGYQRFGERIAQIRHEHPQLKVYALEGGRQSMPFYARTKIRGIQKLPTEKHYLLLVDAEHLKSLKETIRYRILDRSRYYKHSDSRVWQILNIAKGYRKDRPDRTGELLLLEVTGKRERKPSKQVTEK